MTTVSLRSMVEERTIRVSGEINSDDIWLWHDAIDLMIEHDTRRPIRFLINSPGGDGLNALSFARKVRDVSQRYNLPIITRGQEQVCSAAISILLTGTDRAASANTVFLVHNAHIQSPDADPVVIALMNHGRTINILNRNFQSFVAMRTGLGLPLVRRLCSVDRPLTADGARYYRLIHRVL